ncbi:dihydrolipoamide acetyltransferase family protein [Antarcticimicrobium luteum]|uniref:Dihydrolipoamide acetyltransferase component of pyruvate dehydrogenase complex n=1 Tax=Antarcticimicrobium luteum TaxID=2547397 RepID=A0A4R5V024_9RHOB|nr:dihydrolipoamide acetyltransferase family protein [Antarcticimicrobium luteum]TDK45039.1 2-oxo acid dehydrogenase subunit E2 [Antarcticimicrobium luteum]
MGVFRMPSLGSDMESAVLAEWLVQPGDTVTRGDVIAVVETQKGAIEIEVYESGTVTELTARVGTELPVGAPLAVIAAEREDAAEPEGKSQAPAAETPVAKAPEAPPMGGLPPGGLPPGGIAASPAARVRAQALGVDLAALTGSGPGGAVVLADVEAAAPAPAPEPEKPRRRGLDLDEMRKAIANAMSRANREIPHFHLSQTFDLTPAADFLTAHNAGKPPAERLLMAALYLRAAVGAARAVPELNGWYEDGFRPSDTVNIGLAVALRGGGLVAPALIGAEAMDLAQIMAGMRDLVSRARAGRLRNSEMTQGTLTVSALGETGPEAMAGVIFPPQVALLGIGAPQLRPWVVDGQVIPRQVLTVTLAADHRVADGRIAAGFLTEFISLVSAPERL